MKHGFDPKGPESIISAVKDAEKIHEELQYPTMKIEKEARSER